MGVEKQSNLLDGVRKGAAWLLFGIAVCLYCAPLVKAVARGGNAFAAHGGAGAADYPARPITIIAPASPGGGWDQLARLMQHVLTTENISMEPVEVVNRGGAGGTIGLTELITQHRADPYALMVGGSTLVSALVMHDSRFNLSEVDLIARLASEYNVVAVAEDSPFRDFNDLLAAFKKDPKNFVWGGGSAGSADHLLIGLIAREAGVDPAQLNYVAYTGGGEAAAAVMGRQVAAGVAGYAEWKDLAAAKKMRLLAISAPERLAGVDVPVVKEFGLDIVLENWRFVVAPPGIQPMERQRILEMITAMRNTEEWRRILDKYFWQDSFLTGPELEKFIADETSATTKLLATLGMGALGRGYATTGPYLFPAVILGALVVLGGLLIFQAFQRRRGSVAGEAAVVEAEQSLSWRLFAFSALLVLMYIFALSKIGFYFSTPVYLVLQALLMGECSLRPNMMTFAVFFTGAVSLLFEKFLLISVP